MMTPDRPSAVSPAPARPRWRPGRIVAGYAAVAAGWLGFSHLAVGAPASGPDAPFPGGVVAGLGFVAATTALLGFALRRAFAEMAANYASLQAHQTEVERLKRLHAVHSQINQAIVWTTSREALFAEVCRALVVHGGFRLAWIGWHDPETQLLAPVADYGDENDDLKNVKVYADDRPEGRGPMGRAFRTGRPVVSNDYQNDPVTAPWRTEARRRDIRASAAFQIRVREQPAGVLGVFAHEAGFFRDRELALLAEAANDISFALDNLLRKEEHRLAEEIARNEKRFSDAMIESMPGILYFYDSDGRFLRWNRNFETVSGYSHGEIARMHPRDFFPPPERAALEARIGEVFAKGESSLEAPFLARDGTSTLYFFTGRRVVFNDRTCLVGVGIDVSERKRAEDALRRGEQRFRSTIDGILEGCQLIGFDWRYLYLNEAAAAHNRRPNAELLGKTMPAMWPGIEQSPLFTLLRQCMEQRRPFHEETEFGFPDGAKGWFDVRCQPVKEGIFVLSIDISERKQAEAALRELNANLEHKVAQRTAELRDALVRAESADQLKSAFLATMSHELRTPLNSIIGFTGIVLQGLAGPLTAEQTKQLGMVRGSARHLLELINDVLDLSKIEAGQLETRLEPFELAPTIERVTASVQPLAEKKGLVLAAVVAPELGRMTSDRRRLEQILLNLLNNAIKFTARGRVTLTVGIVRDHRASPDSPPGPAARFAVADTGIGIQPADLPTLFQPFRQIDTGLQRQHEGTGLGLAICRRLAHLLGGEIAVASDPPRGSEFTLTLPLHRTPAP